LAVAHVRGECSHAAWGAVCCRGGRTCTCHGAGGVRVRRVPREGAGASPHAPDKPREGKERHLRGYVAIGSRGGLRRPRFPPPACWPRSGDQVGGSGLELEDESWRRSRSRMAILSASAHSQAFAGAVAVPTVRRGSGCRKCISSAKHWTQQRRGWVCWTRPSRTMGPMATPTRRISRRWGQGRGEWHLNFGTVLG
jgi:hypothetical protein